MRRRETKRNNLTLATRRLRHVARVELLLAAEITAAFAKTRDALRSIMDQAVPTESPEGQQDILKGIAETLEIKVESLREGLHEFRSNCRAIIREDISNRRVTLANCTFRFKKEILLHEICTYEEILTHSVSRLRQSPCPIAAGAAVLLDSTFDVLESILKKRSITIIRPATGTKFNAQEHEVLMAEKQDGFAAGEIIKVLTSGYGQKERVILRANVVAAR